jgi:hypothetical protein
MTGPALAQGPGLACRDFLTACSILDGTGDRVRAQRPGPPEPSFVSAESHAVWEAMRMAFLPMRPGASPARPSAQEEILRSPAARRALALFADAMRFGEPSASVEKTERHSLAGFSDNTPERIARMLEKKRGLERKALTAFCRKHGAEARFFTSMDAGQRREYLWMWAQSAFLAKRRFARAAEACARASVA